MKGTDGAARIVHEPSGAGIELGAKEGGDTGAVHIAGESTRGVVAFALAELADVHTAYFGRTCHFS